MKHLSNDDLIAAVEGQTLHVEHLDVCDACHVRVEELREILSEAREVEIPEPSPLFWDHFSKRVRASIAEEPQKERWASVGAPSRGSDPALWMKVPSWNRWGWAWPAGMLAALALAIVAIVITRSQDGSAGPGSATAALRGAGPPGSNIRGAGAPGSNNDAPGSELPSLAPPTDDPSWVFMTDLAGDLDWDGAGAAGLVARPGSAERALENLSMAEQETLLDVLQQELGDRATSSI